MDRRPAVAVSPHYRRALGTSPVLVAPAHQRDHDRVQVAALRGQPVLVPGALTGLLVRDAAQQILVYQPGQPVAEDLAGRAGPPLHVTKPADAAEHLAEHEERPLLPDDFDRGPHRAVGWVVIQDPGLRHPPMLNLVDRLSNPGSS